MPGKSRRDGLDRSPVRFFSFPASTLQGAPFMLLATAADGNSSEFATDTIFADALGG